MRLNFLDERLKNLPPTLYAKLSELDQLRGRWHAGQDLSPTVAINLKKSVLATSTGASTRIEGSKLSDEEVVRVMKGLEIKAFASRDEQEVRGYFEVLEVIFENFDNIRFSESQILSLHSQLLKYVDKDQLHKGGYKHRENEVQLIGSKGESIGTLFETTPAYLTPKQMNELVTWTIGALDDKIIHPMVIIGSFVVQFLKIHPFIDGNGRMSRLLTNLLLLQAGQDYALYSSHEKLVEDSKIEYYLALRRSQLTFGTTSETIVPWLEYFLSLGIIQLTYALNLVDNQKVENLLSTNQSAIWAYAQTADDFAIRDIIEATKIPRPSVSQSLDKLIEYRLIERIGLGRSTRYRIIRG